MRYLSLFSGIEAATQAWQPLGWECVGVSEIEPFPCAVLAHHYPDVPNLGDVTKITEDDIKKLGQIDLVVFGFPCQDLSVAGGRKGFQGERSSLFYDAIRVIEYAKRHCGTRFALLENVPGAFSSNKGADFTEVVKHMAGLDELNTPTNGWGKEGAAVGSNGLLEWSVLDAQWFGLAQRRKRVFAIVDFGDWTSRPPILLERESLRGDSAPSRETKQDVTANAQTGFTKQGHGDYRNCGVGSTCTAHQSKDCSDLIVCHGTQDPITNTETAYALGCNSGQENVIAIAGNIIGRTDGNGGNGNGFDESGACYTLTTNDRHAVAFAEPRRARGCDVIANNEPWPTLPAHAGTGGGNVPMIAFAANPTSVVRRLTPIECERLQGFPDDFTKIPYRNKSADDCPNGVRYKALGNSMAVNVMAWIGQKIQQTQGVKVYGAKTL